MITIDDISKVITEDMESQSDQSVIDFVKESFYGTYLEGLKGKYRLIHTDSNLEFVRIPSLAPLYDP